MKMIIFAAVFTLTSQAFAQDCSPQSVNPENAGEYLQRMAEALTNVKEQFLKMNSVRANKNSDTTDAMVALKELAAGYYCSSKIIEPYKNSKNSDIATSAETLTISYKALGLGVENSVKELRNELDGKSAVPEGTKADLRASQMIEIKKTYQLINLAISIGTVAAVQPENLKTKKRDTLIISKTDRDRITKLLKNTFSFPLKSGGNDGIDVAAAGYYHFLKQQWKFKD